MLLLGVSGCSNNSSLIKVAGDALNVAIRGFPGTPLDRDQIEALPYASLAAKLGKGPRSLLVLGKVAKQELHWYSADHIVMVTYRGRLMKTAGLPKNLSQTLLYKDDPFKSPRKPTPGTSAVTRVINLSPDEIYQDPVVSTWQGGESETIEIVNRRYETVRWEEVCRCKISGWKFTNTFWFDPEHALVWRSEQHIHHELPPITIEMLKQNQT